MPKILKVSIGSFFIGIIVFLIKYLAFHLTGSVALYSDALENLVNIIASIAVIFAVKYSAKPADNKHHFGHYKAEYLSAVLEGVFIILTGFAILREAYIAFYVPRIIDVPFIGLMINSMATIINGLWAVYLIRMGKKYRSPAIKADGHHIMSDFISSVGVAIGLVLAIVTGWMILDVILAVLVALNILWAGIKLVKDSVDGLMDAAPDVSELNAIKDIINNNSKKAIEAHDIKVRRAGGALFIDFHLVVDGKMTVKDSHDICDELERNIERKFSKSHVNIHVEPEFKAKSPHRK